MNITTVLAVELLETVDRFLFPESLLERIYQAPIANIKRYVGYISRQNHRNDTPTPYDIRHCLKRCVFTFQFLFETV